MLKIILEFYQNLLVSYQRSASGCFEFTQRRFFVNAIAKLSRYSNSMAIAIEESIKLSGNQYQVLQSSMSIIELEYLCHDSHTRIISRFALLLAMA